MSSEEAMINLFLAERSSGSPGYMVEIRLRHSGAGDVDLAGRDTAGLIEKLRGSGPTVWESLGNLNFII